MTNMCLSEERLVIAGQIERFSEMLGQIDVLLEKPSNGFDENLISCLKDSLKARKAPIQTLIKESELFLGQIKGMEIASRCRQNCK